MTDTPIAPIATHAGWSLFERPPGPDGWRNFLLLAPVHGMRRWHLGVNTAERRLSWNRDVRGLERRHPQFITGFYACSPSPSNTRPPPAAMPHSKGD
jgi:hypothetical protein